MERAFSRLGCMVGRHPLKVLAADVLLVAIGLSGLTKFSQESRADKLWIPAGTVAQADQLAYESIFPPFSRPNTLIMRPSGGGDAISKENLMLAMEMWQRVAAAKSMTDAVEYGLLDLCVKDYAGGHQCAVTSVLEKWNYDLVNLEADFDVLATLNAGSTPSELAQVIGGKITLSDNGTEVWAAEALRLNIMIESHFDENATDYSDPISEAWELAFVEVGLACLEGLECDVNAFRSFEDELGAAVAGDLGLVSFSWMIIILYLTVALSGLPMLRSRIALSLGSVVCVGACIGCCIGMGSFLGFVYTPMHSLLPFILLGLGVDDSFVIENAFRQTKNMAAPMERRMSHALSHAGVSVAVTSLTDVSAFLVSTATTLPALRSFCVYAALGIFILFLLQCTAFASFLVIDDWRIQSHRYDLLCCLQAESLPQNHARDQRNTQNESCFSCNITKRIGSCAVHRHLRLFIIGSFLSTFGIMLNGAMKLSVDDTLNAFMPDGSYLVKAVEAQKSLFGDLGYPVEIVTTDIEYHDTLVQARLAAVRAQLSGLEMRPPFIRDPNSSGTYACWYEDFIRWVTTSVPGLYETAVAVHDGVQYTVLAREEEFYPALKRFLATTDGRFYAGKVTFSGEASILGAAILSEYSAQINNDAFKTVEAMKGLRAIVNDWEPLHAFPWSYEYLRWETFVIIHKELLRGLGLCMAAVVLVMVILLADVRVAVCVFLCVSFTIVDVLGVLYYAGLSIDTVSVVNLVLAVGLSVDYSAHIAKSFLLKHGTLSHRVLEALDDVGVAVLHGGVSTFLAVMLLSFADRYTNTCACLGPLCCVSQVHLASVTSFASSLLSLPQLFCLAWAMACSCCLQYLVCVDLH
ncbi:unnamed protein product [Chrysoparadoxa australica]